MTHVTSIPLVMRSHPLPVLTEELTDGTGLVVSEKTGQKNSSMQCRIVTHMQFT